MGRVADEWLVRWADGQTRSGWKMARDHSVSAADNFGGLARAIVRARRMIFSCCPVLGWANLRVCIIHMAECQLPTSVGSLHRDPAGMAWGAT